MGIQIHSNSVYRQAVLLVQDGTIGKVKEVHTWSSKKWGDTSPKPDRSDPVPAGFNWDQWLGVCAARPFIGKGYYHPGNWRMRIDFGTGTFGDMGCHIYDPVFKALALTAPLSVRSEGPAPNAHSWATDAIIHYVFPGTQFTDGKTARVTWYDGDQRPPLAIQELVKTKSAGPDAKPWKLTDQGSIIIGTKGVLLVPHVARPKLFPVEQYADFKMPEAQSANHWHQFVDAILGQGRTQANFDYAGPLTEAVLLGSVASRFPMTTLEWNARKMTFNVKAANQFVRREYRKGWAVKGLS
jgi:predicted dehydrogenase